LSFRCERAPAKLQPRMHRRTRQIRLVSGYDSKSISEPSIERSYVRDYPNQPPREVVARTTASRRCNAVHTRRRSRGGVANHHADRRSVGAFAGAGLSQLCGGQRRTNLVAMSCSKSEAIPPNTGSTTATSARLATGHTSPRCSTSSPYCRRDPKDRCPYALSPHNSIVKPWIERQLPDLSVYLLSILAFVREPPQDEFLGQISSRSLARLSQM